MSVDIWHLSEKDIKKLKQCKVIVSMSGGKDSTAVALLLERNGIDFNCVFMDTGWEHPALYKYIDEVLEPRFGAIERLKNKYYPGGMKQLIRQKGFFPKNGARYCTQELKQRPFNRYLKSIEEEVIYVVGIRRQESESRANALRWDYDKVVDCDVFRPLVDHSFDDVIAMHQQEGIAPNPLYLQGANRVGCFPCIFSKKAEVDRVAKLWPARIDEIAELEIELADSAKKRYETDEEWRNITDEKVRQWAAYYKVLSDAGVSKRQFQLYLQGKFPLSPEQEGMYQEAGNVTHGDKGFDFEFAKFFKRSFFFDRMGSLNPSIREVVEWSKTTHGGRQLKLFDLGAVDGCMRWGMCESPLADAELVKIQEPDSE